MGAPAEGFRVPFTLVVVSGKGGTGKTCVAASLLCLHPEALGVDGDVEAPNLCLMLGATYRESDLVRVPRPVWIRTGATGAGPAPGPVGSGRCCAWGPVRYGSWRSSATVAASAPGSVPGEP